MGRRAPFWNFWFWVLIVSLPVSAWGTPPAAEILAGETATSSTVPQEASKKRFSRCQKAIISALVIAGFVIIPTVFHDANAAIRGKEHLGRGIYLNMDQVRTALSAEERAAIDNAQTDPVRATQVLIDRLKGDYGNWMFSPFALSSDATEYFSGAGSDRGVCRHKACVLAGILRAQGVDARLESGTNFSSPYSWHVWVYLPKLDLIADPTTGRLEKPQDFYREFGVRLNGVPLAGGWY